MRVLVVGLNPSRKLGKSPTIKTLNKWLDLLNLKRVSFVNLYEGYELDQGEKNKACIKSISGSYDKILALGNGVSDNLKSMGISHHKLSHPSGLNRQINDPIFVHEMLEACKNYLYGDNNEILREF